MSPLNGKLFSPKYALFSSPSWDERTNVYRLLLQYTLPHALVLGNLGYLSHNQNFGITWSSRLSISDLLKSATLLLVTAS